MKRTSLFPYNFANSVSLAICASSGLTLTRGTFKSVVEDPLPETLLDFILLIGPNGISIGNGFLDLLITVGACDSAK